MPHPITYQPGFVDPLSDEAHFKINRNNVKSYGARGNDTDDDTNAIQNAINDCANSGGGVVYIPTGTYLIKGIYIPSHVHVQGAGIENTTLHQTATGTVVKLADPNANYANSIQFASLSRLMINGSNTATTGIICRYFVDGGYVRDVYVYQINGTGIDISRTWSVDFSSVRVRYCSGQAWKIWRDTSIESTGPLAQVNNVKFDTCIGQNSQNGYYISGDQATGVFVNCDAESNTYEGFLIEANCTLVEPHCEANVDGIRIGQTTATNAVHVFGGSVNDSGSGNRGIRVDQYASNAVIIGTRFVGDSNTVDHILISSSASGVVVINPYFYGGPTTINDSGKIATVIGLAGRPMQIKEGVQISGYGTTSRPTLTSADSYTMIFDTTLGEPIWWNGTVWVDATGTTV